MVLVPTWREEPQPVMVRCQEVRAPSDPGYRGDLIVQFETSEGQFVAFVDVKHVRVDDKLLKALVVADVGDEGDWLVGLPAETFTSGPQILVRAGERDKVLVTDVDQ